LEENATEFVGDGDSSVLSWEENKDLNRGVCFVIMRYSNNPTSLCYVSDGMLAAGLW